VIEEPERAKETLGRLGSDAASGGDDEASWE
jgi:hypothetical protein